MSECGGVLACCLFSRCLLSGGFSFGAEVRAPLRPTDQGSTGMFLAGFGPY